MNEAIKEHELQDFIADTMQEIWHHVYFSSPECIKNYYRHLNYEMLLDYQDSVMLLSTLM